MKTKRNLVLATLGVALGTMLVLTQVGWSDAKHEGLKLEGSWIGRVPGAPVTWTYVLAPCDATGQRASISGSTVNIDASWGGMFPGAQFSAIVGDVVRTGWNTARVKTVFYGVTTGPGGLEIVYVEVETGTVKQTGPGKLETTHTHQVYLPTQDTDGDGLPEPGQTPVLVYGPYTSIDTRVALLSP